MRDMILLTLPDGSPILINENGLCIESEKDTGRSIVTLPHNHRHGKPTLTVTESFQNIVDLVFPLPTVPAPYSQPKSAPQEDGREYSWGMDVGQECSWTENPVPATDTADINFGEQKDAPDIPNVFTVANPPKPPKSRGKRSAT